MDINRHMPEKQTHEQNYLRLDFLIRSTRSPFLRAAISCSSKRIFSSILLSSHRETRPKRTAFRYCTTMNLSLLTANFYSLGISILAFGQKPEAAAEVCAAVKKACKKPVYMKLSPNVTSITEIAKACEEAGADGIVLINTLLGMRIEPRTGKPIVSTGAAGFSGPAVKPIAVRMVYQVYETVKCPIIGVGGIATADDVIEMMSAGATAVEVGAANLVDPYACRNIIEELPVKMEAYGIERLSDIIGRAHV